MIHLQVRSPECLVLDEQVDAIRAEDRSGWFGILPGRSSLVAILPPGFLLYRKGDTEGFIAFSGGVMNLARNECRVMATDAVSSAKLETLEETLREYQRVRKERSQKHQQLSDSLAKEALRRLVKQERLPVRGAG